MSLKALNIPFQQILTVVKTLSPAQKEKLRAELNNEQENSKKITSFTQLLLKGPIYTKKQIETIENNRKSITVWRTRK